MQTVAYACVLCMYVCMYCTVRVGSIPSHLLVVASEIVHGREGELVFLLVLELLVEGHELVLVCRAVRDVEQEPDLQRFVRTWQHIDTLNKKKNTHFNRQRCEWDSQQLNMFHR